MTGAGRAPVRRGSGSAAPGQRAQGDLDAGQGDGVAGAVGALAQVAGDVGVVAGRQLAVEVGVEPPPQPSVGQDPHVVGTRWRRPTFPRGAPRRGAPGRGQGSGGAVAPTGSLLLPTTDAGVAVQVVALVLATGVALWAVRRHREAVLLVVGIATFLAGLMALRAVH